MKTSNTVYPVRNSSRSTQRLSTGEALNPALPTGPGPDRGRGRQAELDGGTGSDLKIEIRCHP